MPSPLPQADGLRTKGLEVLLHDLVKHALGGRPRSSPSAAGPSTPITRVVCQRGPGRNRPESDRAPVQIASTSPATTGPIAVLAVADRSRDTTRVLERDSRAIDPRSGLAVCVREVGDGLSSGGRISRVDYDQTREVLAAFEREGVDYVVFGGVAMNLQGLPRATEDLDVFVAPTEDNIRRLRQALASVFTDPHIEEITATDLLGSYPAIQYVPPDGGFHLDILTRLGEAFRFEDLKSERSISTASKSPSSRPTCCTA